MSIEEQQQVTVGSLTFTYRIAKPGTERRGDVLCLPGFPEWAQMYDELLLTLVDKGFRCVAFDQRGYSEGASPDNVEDYHYDKLREDIFAVASALGFGDFHLVGHDHGALLGWYAAGTSPNKARLLSYTAISVPHPDAFSEGLLGEQSDPEQQSASQYFDFFAPEESATGTGFVSDMVNSALGKMCGFEDRRQYQKALWWYHGALAAGMSAKPPSMTAGQLFKSGYVTWGILRLLLGGRNAFDEDGVPQTTPVGKISIPVLYICGNKDAYIFGCKEFALKTENFCDKSKYRFLEVDCGHDFPDKGMPWPDSALVAIASHIGG